MFARSFARLNSTRFASTLVIAEQSGNKLSQGTLAAVSAANKLGGDVSVLLLGKDLADAAKEASSISSVSKVLVVDNEVLATSLPEDLANAAKQVLSSSSYTHIIAPSSNTTKSFIPRLAVQFDSAPLTEVTQVIDEETFQRPIYAGNAISTVKMTDKLKFLIIRPSAFDKVAPASGSAPIETPALNIVKDPSSTFIKSNVVKSERPELTSARVIVAGGRGMKSGENFSILTSLADKLNGAVGASRAAVDAGFISNEFQIGQTGKIVAPDLYIAVGISGAIQHLSGMKDSKTIVAINKDKEAPIFQVADYGLVEDLFKAVPELESKL